jgi:hypothetical protein
MPYMYAIEETVYEDGIPPQPGEKRKRFTYAYHPVSKDVAETNEDGRWKLVSVHGTSATKWNRFSSRGESEVQYFAGKGTPLPDANGTMLAHNDLVMTTIDKYSCLRLCEVVNFTPQKIRVRDLNSGYEMTLKYPEDIVKVDSSLYL